VNTIGLLAVAFGIFNTGIVKRTAETSIVILDIAVVVNLVVISRDEDTLIAIGCSRLVFIGRSDGQDWMVANR
jgi:hypothetical protein